MRVPTYAHYMNLSSAIQQNKSHVDQYSYQSVSGLKHQTYSGYGMKAYNIVSMESTLQVNNTFQENNKLANISLTTSNLAIETITDALANIRTSLNDLLGSGLTNISPDVTGGKLTFTSDSTATYVGKTLTVNGTTYTFALDDTETTNINLSGLSSKEEIMQAIANKVNNPEFVYKNGKLSFPLYTINGTSTVLTEEPAKSAVETGDAYTMNKEQSLALQNVQKLAFSTMQMIADALNTNVSGKYIFGGGSTVAPVNFDYSSLDEFQKYYDGVNTVYPSTTSSVLSNFAVDSSNTGDIQFIPDTTAANKGTIKALGGDFLEAAVVMNASNVGEVTFDSSSNTMQATEYGAYSSLNVGDTVVLNGTNTSLGNNAKAYIIKSISSDGRTVTFDDTTTLETSVTVVPDNDIVVNKTFPLGSVINLDGFGNNNLTPSATVIGISDDGTELYVKADGDRFPAMVSTGDKWSINAETYYRGGSLEYNQRISESQTINFDVKASDPAFEKIFRALGQIAQGNLVDTSDPIKGEDFDPNKTRTLVQEALTLIGSATSDAGDISREKNSSLYSITAKISADYTILNKVIENQRLAAANLETNISQIKDADKEEAAVKLLMSENALEASYSILSSVSKMSLLNYLK